MSPTDKDDRGRKASSPTQMPLSAWRDIAIRTWRESSTDNVGLIAAGVAFYAFLAFVPALGAFVLSYGLLADPATIADHLQALFRLMPQDAAKLVGDQLLSVTSTAEGKKGLGLALALVLAIYGAMNGASAIITALNIAYEEEESRSFFRTSWLALLITLGLLLAAIVGAFAIAALAFLEKLMPGASDAIITLIRVGFWVAAALATSMVVGAIYRFAPDRRPAQWRWLTAGSLFTTLGWLAASVGFSFYVANFGNYGATYGALSAVVVMLMWLYLSAYILILGAELNSEIEHQTMLDSTVGAPKPMGQRDAYVADTVGEVP
ncbi:MAG TPA: YihY/virulence factor BrkB family protein [Sphingobium sp.]|nr:YihY/virulence factor BrkB family protein [Sphingobium sp.]